MKHELGNGPWDKGYQPSGISKAAEDSWAFYEYRESPRGLYSTCYVDGFMAGARWAMEQGVTIDGCVTAIANERWLDIDDDRADEVLSKFHNDEKVIVQIRKKDE